jgi:tripartite-type tricarboxylate transporter receptor subunit TctC
MSDIRIFAKAALLVGCLCTASTIAVSQSFPSKPIKVIVPYPPGGNTDLVARHFAQRMGDTLHTSVVIDNRAGAAGMVGAAAVAHADPDGYTILHSTNSELAVLPAIQSRMPFNPLQDFAPISTTGVFPFVVVVKRDLPARTMKELVEIARQRPATLTFASAGVGTANHLILEPFKSTFNIDVVHVPYKGGGPAANDLLGGHVDASFATLSSVLSLVQSGQLPALMVTSEKRTPLLPDVPSAGELGYPDLVVMSWNAFLAPAGTPREIVDKLHDAIVDAAKDPNLNEEVRKAGSDIQTSTPEGVSEQIKAEIARWRKLTAGNDIKLDQRP